MSKTPEFRSPTLNTDPPRKTPKRKSFYLPIVGVVLVGSVLALIAVFMIAGTRKTVVQSNLRQIGLACHNYESARMELPSNTPKRGAENGLSWRVKILPQINKECGKLFGEFHHDEPWDSPHNMKLIASMPDVFKHPVLQSGLPEGHTVFQMPTSSPEDRVQAIQVEGRRGRSLRRITDGPQHTVLVLETNAQSAVPWTQPVDWRFDASNPKKNLGDAFSGGTYIAMGDCSVHFLETENITDELFTHMITPTDGKIVQILKKK